MAYPRIQVHTRDLSYLGRSVQKRISINLLDSDIETVHLGAAYKLKNVPGWKVFNYVLMDYFREDVYRVEHSIDIPHSIIDAIPSLRGLPIEFSEE